MLRSSSKTSNSFFSSKLTVLICAGHSEIDGDDRMKKVNLEFYFGLAEGLQVASQICSRTIAIKGSEIYFPLNTVAGGLARFITEDNGFVASKHAARELMGGCNGICGFIFKWEAENSEQNINRFSEDIESWVFNGIPTQISKFRNAFSSECNEVSIYSVGMVSIYNTSALVERASSRIPEPFRNYLPQQTLTEFDQAGKCLAFGLSTGCGFHALRGLELVMEYALKKYGWSKKKPSNWDQYVKAFVELGANNDGFSPSPKVSSMIDRMRQIDRNPIMHPEDTLDESAADMLFGLCAITATELIRDLDAKKLLNAGG